MSHIHIPDGVLPFWLWATGYALALAIVAYVSYRQRSADLRRRLPLLGVLAAVMLVGMSTEIVPIAYHLNLSVLAGIIVGPSLGVIAAFIVSFILALFGHGGVTTVGLNTLLIGAECAIGYYLFRLLGRVTLSRLRSPALAAGLATALTLLVTTSALIGIVGLSSVDPGKARDTGPLDAATLSLDHPFQEGFVTSRLLNPEKEEAGDFYTRDSGVSLARFAAVVYLLGFLGWLIEGTITGLIVSYVYRVRPGLLGESGNR